MDNYLKSTAVIDCDAPAIRAKARALAEDIATPREKSFVPVEFDGTADARLSTHTQNGPTHIEYTREHGHYDELPWVEILGARDELLAGMGVDVDTFMAKWKESE